MIGLKSNMNMSNASEVFAVEEHNSEFARRHIGPLGDEIDTMLRIIGEESLDSLIDKIIPKSIRSAAPLALGEGVGEAQALDELRVIASENQLKTNMIGQGYYGCFMPEVIRRNVFEAPSWYTAYTPYQPEIAQGRLEVLFNFQTLVAELTGMAIANASLLDEGTAAAEAMALCHRALRAKRSQLRVSIHCHPQTIDILRTRAEPLGIGVQVVDDCDLDAELSDVFAVLVQYPGTDGSVNDYTDLIASIHEQGCMSIVAADLLALTLLTPPGEFGADVVVGSAQRFGVPMGFGGPHAAFMATTDKHKRSLPGRLIGQSIDAQGNVAYRLALQTREQHIRREKATSNICTAQALLAIIATLFACYHGPAGLRAIAMRITRLTDALAETLAENAVSLVNTSWFDTLRVTCDADRVIAEAAASGINLRRFDKDSVSLSIDETTSEEQLCVVASVLCNKEIKQLISTASVVSKGLQTAPLRADNYLTQPCFHRYRSETEMMRYLRRLADKDLALDRTMIPLGSCTMKLNAAAEMAPLAWPEFSQIHPFAPADQTAGYQKMITQLEQMLCACTGYDAVSLQPNAGSQGEYAGLLAIRAYHHSRGEMNRTVCLIPSSAHGTNPASAQMAGMQVIVVACDDEGNVDLDDLDEKIAQHGAHLAAIMITYPSTHGVFESRVTEVCERVHKAGGQVYIDGANLNAMVGLAEPGKFGGDVSHLNLHKTFCIPHGGGGPGVGPVAVGEHLREFLPGHRLWGNAVNAISSAPWGSAMILPISWMYIRMMGATGLLDATQIAILNANYIAKRLEQAYPILYKGEHGYVAHECIIDVRPFKEQAGISVDDIAKRLMDFGFHAPTMSFPVPGTLMIEPTESESLQEMDRFVDAMLCIRDEIDAVVQGKYSIQDNPLVNAPHTAKVVLQDQWDHSYSRQQAAFPSSNSEEIDKYWPPVARIDNVYGDKNLVCSCPPLESYQ